MKLHFFDDEILSKKTQKVDPKVLSPDFYESFQGFMKDNGGIGLAANQVGFDHSLFFIDSIGYFVNPEIVEMSGKISIEEGCLSFPHMNVRVPRAKEVRIQFLNERGEEKEEVLKDIWSIVAQHENDHINGITFIDHLKPVKKRIALKKIRRLKRVLDLKKYENKGKQ